MIVLRDDVAIAMARWRYYPDLPQQAAKVNVPPGLAEMVKPDGDLSAGTWTMLNSCADTNTEMYEAMMDYMHEIYYKFMSGKPHYLIELLGTAHEAQGTGAGRLLLETLAREADERGVETFVQTNNIVVKFYEKMGYMIRERKMMPGNLKYEEFALVRTPRGR